MLPLMYHRIEMIVALWGSTYALQFLSNVAALMKPAAGGKKPVANMTVLMT